MMKYNDWAEGKLEYDLMVSSGHKMVWERISWDMHISHFQSSYSSIENEMGLRDSQVYSGDGSRAVWESIHSKLQVSFVGRNRK